MEQEITSGNRSQPYGMLSELTVVDKPEYTGNIYQQLLRSLPGSISVDNLSTPFLALPLNNSFNLHLKRGIDILIASIVILAVLSWLIPLMALLIKIDSRGPVFFLQQRNKRNGAIFTCIKFRSMIVNDEADILPAGKFDKRITRMGAFMRGKYLDELPQFFNVLFGDMSLIGPRPHMLSDNLRYEEQVDYYAYRHKVKPGITGLAQVMGYVGTTDNVAKMKDRVNMDIFYLRHWTLKMDLLILVRTVTSMFK